MSRAMNRIDDPRIKLGFALLAAGALATLGACGGDDSGTAAAGGAGLGTSSGGSGATGAGDTGGSGATGAGDTGGSGAAGGGGLNVSKLQVGDPTFDVVDVQLFSANLGTQTSDFVERADTLEGVLPEHTFLLDYDLLGPSTESAPPYDAELGLGVVGQGYVSRDRYLAADWTAPQGIYFAATVVPAGGAPQGSSTDFANGPIIPTSIFPITVDMDLWKGGTLLDEDFDFDYPTIDELAPEAGVEGFSHMPLSFYRNSDLIGAAPDTYQFRLRIVDANGNGWRVYVPFFVE